MWLAASSHVFFIGEHTVGREAAGRESVSEIELERRPSKGSLRETLGNASARHGGVA